MTQAAERASFRGGLYGLLAAALFGLSAPIAKRLLGEVSPQLQISSRAKNQRAAGPSDLCRPSMIRPPEETFLCSSGREHGAIGQRCQHGNNCHSSHCET